MDLVMGGLGLGDIGVFVIVIDHFANIVHLSMFEFEALTQLSVPSRLCGAREDFKILCVFYIYRYEDLPALKLKPSQ